MRSAGTNASGNGDLKEVYAIDASKGNMTRLADLLYPRFSFQLISIPGGDVLAVGGGQHIKKTEVSFSLTFRPAIMAQNYMSFHALSFVKILPILATH